MSSLDFPCDYDRILAEERPMAASIATFLQYYVKPNCVFDFGCGPGLYVEEMWKCSIPAIGFDIDPRVEQYKHCVKCDLTSRDTLVRPDSPVDVVLCLEVAEHIDPVGALKLLDRCVEHGYTVIWTAAQPGQGGEGHINCRPVDYWMEQFELRGMTGNQRMHTALLNAVKRSQHMGWFVNNLLVYSHA